MPVIKKENTDSQPEICSPKHVQDAVSALKILNEKFVENLKKRPLLEDVSESPVYLQVILKKIPPPQLLRMIRVSLPHSLVTETSDVCLITGDLEKRNHKAEIEPTVLHYKDLLKKLGVTNVNKVIPLRQLRTEYKTYESRRQLAAAYDVFLADKKIAGVLPKTLGKTFFKERKFPVQIDMRRPNLKNQIDKALCQTEFSLTCRGNSYSLEVARLSMADGAITENVMACVEVLANKLPGKWNNVLGLYLKTAKSKAIPVYISLDISSDVLITKSRKNKKFKLGELSTVDDADVKVFRDGRVIVKKIKKNTNGNEDENDKIMSLDESFSSNACVENEEDTQYSVKTSKKKKGKKVAHLDEMGSNAEIENEEITQDFVANEASPKKKKKSKKVAHLDQVAADSEVKGTQESFTTEVSSKKKKKREKVNIDQVSDKAQMDSEEDFQNSSSSKAASKKRNKNSRIYSQEADANLEDVSECTLLNSKKRKIEEGNAVSENTKQKHTKKEKVTEIEDNERTPLKPKKNKKVGKESTKDSTLSDSLVSKRKNTDVDIEVKSSPELNKRQGNNKKRKSMSLRAK